MSALRRTAATKINRKLPVKEVRADICVFICHYSFSSFRFSFFA